MPWADSQAMLNNAVMHTYSVAAVIIATDEPFRGSFFVPHDNGNDGYLGAAPMSVPDAHLDVYDADALKTPHGTQIRVEGCADVYTVVNRQADGTGLTRLSLRRYAHGG